VNPKVVQGRSIHADSLDRATIAKAIREAERHLATADPIMKRLIAKHGHCPLAERKFQPFHMLANSIISQQLSTRSAATIKQRVGVLVGVPFQISKVLSTDAVLDTNLKAVFRLSRAVIRPMMKQRYGRIISITSVVGASGNAGQANYAAAKAGVAGMTRALARELGSRNITVNCVAPGFIETDMTAGLPEEQQKALLGQIPLGHLGKPADIAHAVSYLASPQAAYVTGQELHVNGGMFMA
jgi:NAD(P)-dependent dehydrogenase (short-subunit alcohol dehydrogenase family)